jgi:hypothetical protein
MRMAVSGGYRREGATYPANAAAAAAALLALRLSVIS